MEAKALVTLQREQLYSTLVKSPSHTRLLVSFVVEDFCSAVQNQLLFWYSCAKTIALPSCFLSPPL